MNFQPEDEGLAKVLRCQSDFAFCDPCEYVTAYCGVCGKSMTATRNVLGPTSSVEAMAIQFGQGTGHLHDRFDCDDRHESWHEQAKAIQTLAHESPSKRISDLLVEEANEIVRTRIATK